MAGSESLSDFLTQGTAVAVYVQLPVSQQTSNWLYDTSVSFFIDGQPSVAPNWTWIPPPAPPYNFEVWSEPLGFFQQEIYNSGPLPPGDHSIKMVSARRPAGGGETWFFLDYIVYRTNDAPQSVSLSNGLFDHYLSIMCLINEPHSQSSLLKVRLPLFLPLHRQNLGPLVWPRFPLLLLL